MTMTPDAAGIAPAPWEEPDDDDLEEHVPRRPVTWFTALLALLVVGGGAFLAGVQVQKHHDKGLTTVSASTTGTASRTGTGAGTTGSGTTGAGGGRGFGGGATIGQVKLVDGSTIYVTDTSGNTVTVNTTGASTFTKSESVALKNIQPGDTVIVRGAAQPDGTIAAASVTDSGAAGTGALAGGFGRFGGGGGRGGGSTTGGSTTGGGATGGSTTGGSTTGGSTTND
jgi:hypothetical protein